MTQTLSREDTAPTLSKAQINVVFITILFGMLLSALDQTIVSTALPTIVGDLGGAGHMSWVVTSYMLAETIATVLAGKFGDLFGRKRMFQISVIVFIVGSFFCGLAQNMITLIAMRAIQGIGGGGIMVTSTALIADVIPLRQRGKYQGALGAVFGVTTVIGPLLGGLFTDHLTWRWAFYVNVPIAIIVVLMASRTIPGLAGTSRSKVDYLGVLFVALGASGLTLATSWGGTEFAWGSPMIIGLFVGSVVALVIFVQVELRAAEPILPMRLFRSRVFTIASILSFIVGFAMLGALTFLPVYMQYVTGATATMSGVRTLPMVVGLLLTAVLSGQVVGVTGRYKPFPIAGAAVIGVGLFLLSRMDEHTSVLLQSVYMFVLGAGIGLVMQVLTIVVQNTADYRDLGSATSGVTFFRTLGSSFGASIMGTIYANSLGDRLARALVEAGVPPDQAATPNAVKQLPEAARAPIVHAYAQTVHGVFLYVVPVAALALVIALFLPQVHMRDTAAAGARGSGEGFAMPTGAESDIQLETVVGRVMRARQGAIDEVLALAGNPVDRATAWGLLRVHLRDRALGASTTVADVEDQLRIPHGVLTSFFEEIVDTGLLERDGELLRLSVRGRDVIEALTEAWTGWMTRQLDEWVTASAAPTGAEWEERLRAALRSIARRAMLENELVAYSA